MAENASQVGVLQGWLVLMAAGDSAARDGLLAHMAGRFQRLARKMLKGFPGVRRWDHSSDVYQGAMLRLLRVLEEVKPATVEELFRLSAQQVRRELIDLARHYYGPEGMGTHLAGRSVGGRANFPQDDPATTSHEPGRLAAWCEFHRQVETLPEKERQIFDLLWYQGLTQVEAADLLHVTERTVRNRWVAARLRIREALHDDLPGM